MHGLRKKISLRLLLEIKHYAYLFHSSIILTIQICYYGSDENQWWLSKHCNKANINSTITCLAWHPNNILLAAGGTDCKARVLSTWIKDLDDK